MPEKDPQKRASVLFERAQKLGDMQNFDYAIEIYLQGLRIIPEAVEQGHIKLFQIGCRRQAKGGKKPSMMEKMKRSGGKEPLEKMLNAEYLFAKDPGNLGYAENMLKAALEGGYNQTAKWLADVIFQMNNDAAKPSVKVYRLLIDIYNQLDQYNRALAACQHAVKLKPNDPDLADEMKNLSAEVTMRTGKYDQGGDFRDSIKNRESQEELHSQGGVVKSENYRELALSAAKKAYQADPNLSKNVHNLADALTGLQTTKGDQEAINVLEGAYKRSGEFGYKEKAGQIGIKSIKRKIQRVKRLAKAHPEEIEQIKADLMKLQRMLVKVELEHYRLCVENYPTDLKYKYEYGSRLVTAKQYDEAIPFLQDARRDPRRKVQAMDKAGYCFYKKGWYSDAIDLFKQAISEYEIKDDSIGKELSYNLALAYEAEGMLDEALGIFRKIAQMDFGYKDVRTKVDSLRKKVTKENS